MNQTNQTLLKSTDIYNILTSKGVHYFHHANTVKTSISFIEEKALLSRSFVEVHNLNQTVQYTDEKDKNLNIWDSVFLDGLDLHKKFLRPNVYGPIMFEISLKILQSQDFPHVRITKSNPNSWQTIDGNFYESLSEFENDYLTGNRLKDGRIMFLFDHPERKILLDSYCERIVVDDPRITIIYADGSRKPIAEMVSNRLTGHLNEANLKIPIEIRHGQNDICNCYHQYKGMYSYNRMNFDRLFKK